MSSRTITFVTGNVNKLKEVKQVLSKTSINFINQDIDLPEFQGTPEEVAKQKCLEAAKYVKGPVMVEDTSLVFNALNGMPGVYIKWFLKAVQPEGLHKMLHGFDDKSGYSQCIFAYTTPEMGGGNVKLFRGTCDGKIVYPRGTKFGWDPIFEPTEQPANVENSENFVKQTFAEMSSEHKNMISHRSRALNGLKDYLEKSN